MSNRSHAAATPFRNDSLPANLHDLRHGQQTQGIHHSPASSSPVAAGLHGVNSAPHSVPGPQQQQHQNQQQQQQQQQHQEVEESSEQVLLASFKAAALSVTQLYKDSLKHQRAEHAKGYEAALQDFLAFIANHPAVQEKKEQGQSEDEIRQSTSLSVDEIVSFISNARDAFTFAAPIFHPGPDQSSLQGLYSGPEGGIGQQMAVDSLKRRYALQDFNIAANRMAAANATRLSNPMNLDAFSAFHDQPPFKRGRRREGEQ
ncbi:hypothetical protein KVV02_003009 [Mortierella alpina]|uniref:Uncharacterized protein n=1 Tax=Mortierella alpina TaxID=64518 RepID=A0A9P7ZXR0_MORAP|nr:hypothetical protein KVV02_003009 [Mortierella alpina]